MEVWKKIEGFESYEVSNYGNVKSLKNNKVRFLKQENNKGNQIGFYKRVSLCEKNIVTRFQVHRLVAIYFIENNDNNKCVNHIDGNPSNNHYKNLEWCTYSENEKHSYDVLGKINPIRKLTTEQANHIKLIGVKGKGSNIKKLANNYSVNVSTIYNILKNKYYAQD